MKGNYLATLLGLVSFFLFKVGLLRMLWDRIPSIGSKRKLPLNDKTLRVILTQYASRHNISQKHITKIDQQIHRRSEKHTSELQSRSQLVCLRLFKIKKTHRDTYAK